MEPYRPDFEDYYYDDLVEDGEIDNWDTQPSNYFANPDKVIDPCPECERRERSTKYYPLCCRCYYKQNK